MDILLRATIIFWAIYLIVRLLGKRELAQLTPFELIVLIAIGDLIQQGVTQNDFSITGAVLAVGTFALWASILAWITYLSPKAEALLDGEPRVIIRDGELIRGNMRRDRVTPLEVETEMRLAGIGRLADVAWGIIESRGRMSFIRREGSGDESQPPEEESVA